MKKLGIVIPTYNRGSFLSSTLDAVIPQLVLFQKEVSLLICDNASNDNTQELINEYQSKYPSLIEYHRHEKNEGYLYNFSYGVQHIDAKYVFLYGSDDITPPLFIANILYLIDYSNNLSLIHFNYIISEMDETPCRLTYKTLENNMIHIYDSGEEFIKHHFDIPSFMSSLVFKKEIWLNSMNDERQFECYAYEWLYIVYRGVLGHNKCLFYEYPIFIQRMSNSESYSHRWAWYSIVGISRVFENLSSDIYSAWKDYRSNYSRIKMLRNVASVYMDKPFYKEQFDVLVKYIDKRIYKLVLIICLFLLPVRLSNFVFFISKRIFIK